jgi:nitric oxide reductase NorE protein
VSVEVQSSGVVPRRRMPGVEGFWVLIGGDLAIFTILFASFLSARRDDPAGFSTARQLLNANVGGANTLLLLTSSWLVAMTLQSLRRGQMLSARRWLGAGILGGVGFVGVKASEYAHVISSDKTDTDNGFLTYYFSLTGLHLAHVVAGCLLLTVFWWRWRRDPAPESTRGFESAAIFWHLVDSLWIVIFPLLYLLRTGS